MAPTDLFTVASRAAVPPFHVMDLLAAAARRQRSHGDLLNLVAGQPSTPAPAPVREAAKRALDEQVLGYTVAVGIPELREAIVGHHRRMHGLDVSLDDVVVTTGSSGGFLLAFLAAFEAGDRVAIARPGYACYRNVLTALGCEVVELPAGPESRFQPTVEMLEALDEPVHGLVVASPANPTGTMLARRARRARDLVRGARRAADQRRDLPRDRVPRRARRCTRRPGRPRARRWCSTRSRSTSR